MGLAACSYESQNLRGRCCCKGKVVYLQMLAIWKRGDSSLKAHRWSSEGVSLSRWLTPLCGFFKRNCLGLQQFLPPTQSLLDFAAWSCGDLSSRHWNPGLGGLMWGWDSLLPRYTSWIFIHHTWVWDQPILCPCPSYQCEWMWFLYFVIVRLPFNSILDISEWW